MFNFLPAQQHEGQLGFDLHAVIYSDVGPVVPGASSSPSSSQTVSKVSKVE